MTEEPEDIEVEPDVEINLEKPDQVAYDELVEKFGEELVNGDLNEAVKQRIRSMYDNQEKIKQQIAQMQNQAGNLQQ